MLDESHIELKRFLKTYVEASHSDLMHFSIDMDLPKRVNLPQKSSKKLFLSMKTIE